MSEPIEIEIEEEKKELKDIRNNIITGIFIVIPLGVTIWFGIIAFVFLTNWAKAILDILPITEAYKNSSFLSIIVRISSLFILTAFLYSIGYIAKYTVGKKFISYTDKLMMKMPMLKTVYSTVSQIMDTIKSSKTEMFTQVVMFEYPRKGIYSLGFITNKNVSPKISEKLQKEVVAVFLPTTPNPTSGFFLLVPKDECILLNIRIDEAMKIIISGGALQPKLLQNSDSKNGEKNGTN